MAGPWKLKEQDGIGILELDVPNTEVNILTSVTLAELTKILTEIGQRTDLKALLFTSAKSRIFIAGADINEIRGISDEKDAFEKAEQGKTVFQLIEDLKIPTVAVINGPCLGGGYELALSCQFRVASHADQVKIGLPEVQLGILPGFGGSIRLPRLVGLMQGLPLILAGKMCSAQQALKNGMIDRVFPHPVLLEEALHFVRTILKQGPGKIRKPRRLDTVTWFFEKTPVGRALFFHLAAKDVRKRTKGFYPAPFEIIALVKQTYGRYSPQAFRLESEHFARLGATPVSKNLIKLFFLTEKYKKLPWTSTKIKNKPVEKCGVIGAGVMGGGIAQLVSNRNIPVRVRDINAKALGGALQEARNIYMKAVKIKKLRKHEVDNKMGLISVGLTSEGLRRCDIIIEAVVENLDIKCKVFKELDAILAPETLLASNTSSLPVTQMAAVCRHPERVVGLHFFNPVNRMPLVEVIRAEQTSDETLERTIQFARSLGKTVIVVRDAAGFLVNRLLMPYMNEAAYLLMEGMPPEKVDKLAVDFGMPMGPIELVDQVGIDVGHKVAHILYEAFGERMKEAAILDDVMKKGLLGKKSKKGFYLYEGKKKRVNAQALRVQGNVRPISDEDAVKRLITIMINEAARCLDEKVIDSAATVDIGMIMGTGFPPFRGGLLHYADTVGLDAIVADLRRFQKDVSQARFEPSPYLLRLAQERRKFYPD